MESKFYIDEYVNKLGDRAEDAFIVVGALGVGWAGDSLRARGSKFMTANLINSLCFATSKEQSAPSGQTTGSAISKPEKLKLRIGTNVVYAAIQEFGGPIKPVKAQALSIPVCDEARGKSPRDFSDLVMIKPAYSDTPLLVRMNADKKTFKVMFILVKAVQIPARPYLRPILDHKEEIMGVFKQAMNG